MASFLVWIAIATCLCPFIDHSRAQNNPAYYTFQLGSFSKRAHALSTYEKLADKLPQRMHDLIRLERVGKYDTIRLGDFSARAEAEEVTRELDDQGLDYWLLQAPVREDRIIIPPRTLLHSNETSRTARATPSYPKESSKDEKLLDKHRDPRDGHMQARHKQLVDTAQQLLDESAGRSAPASPGKLLSHFMNLECSELQVNQAALDNLAALAEETRRNTGLDVRLSWRNDLLRSEDSRFAEHNTARLGLAWDLIEEGFLESRNTSQDYQDRLRIGLLQAKAKQLEEQYPCRNVLMAFYFARLRLKELFELRRVQRLWLEEQIALYHMGRVYLDEVVQAQKGLSKTKKHIATVRRGLSFLPENLRIPDVDSVPLLRLKDARLMEAFRRQAARDVEQLRVEKTMLQRKHDDLNDVDVEIFADAGADREREDTTGELRLGLSLRVPLNLDNEERLVDTAMREKRLRTIKERQDKRFALIRRIKHYSEELTDALAMYHKARLTKERLRRALLHHTLNPEPTTPVLGKSLAPVAKQIMEHLAVRVEMLGVKENLYRRLLTILTKAEMSYRSDMVACWKPDSGIQSHRPGERTVSIRSETFNDVSNEYLLELFRAKGVHGCLLSAGRRTKPDKLARFIARAPKYGLAPSLMHTVDIRSSSDRKNQILERLTRDALVTGRIHLEIRSHEDSGKKGKPKYKENARLQFVRRLRERLQNDVQLTVTIPPSSSPRTTAAWSQLVDGLFIRMDHRMGQEKLLQKLDEHMTLMGDNIVLVLQPSRFPSEYALESFIQELCEKQSLNRFALSDVESYMRLVSQVAL